MKDPLETITLGGGCFWCLDASYKLVNGVVSVVEGYAGGTLPHSSYEQVSSGRTGHAEVVQLMYDPTIIALEDILDIFWLLHDPTTLNRQGYDTGTQYRSIILYETKQQRLRAEASRQAAAQLWDDPIVTEIKQLDSFYAAESSQKDYETARPDYCQLIINPKLQKLREKFSTRIKASNAN